MKYIQIFLIMAVAVIVSAMPLSVHGATITFTDAHVNVVELKAKLATLLGVLSGTLSDKENLSVKATRLKTDVLDAEDDEQHVTFYVQNNRHGGKTLSGLFFPYEVELYEIVGDRRLKLDDLFYGYALIPSAEMDSSFSIELSSESYRTGQDRTFIAKIRIDSDRWVKESSEKDNIVWTDEWTLEGNE